MGQIMTNSNILIYQTEDGQSKIQTRLEDDMYLKKIGISNFLYTEKLANNSVAFKMERT